MSLLQWLADSLWFSVGANVIQWSTVVVWSYAVYAMWHVSCDAHRWCLRPGRHTVEGTSWKTCSNHKQDVVHKRLAHAHKQKHPDRHYY